MTLFDGTDDFYRKHVETSYANGRDPGAVEEPALPAELVARAAAFADTAIISISRFSSEGWDRKSAFDRIRGLRRHRHHLHQPLLQRGLGPQERL